MHKAAAAATPTATAACAWWRWSAPHVRSGGARGYDGRRARCDSAHAGDGAHGARHASHAACVSVTVAASAVKRRQRCRVCAASRQRRLPRLLHRHRRLERRGGQHGAAVQRPQRLALVRVMHAQDVTVGIRGGAEQLVVGAVAQRLGHRCQLLVICRTGCRCCRRRACRVAVTRTAVNPCGGSGSCCSSSCSGSSGGSSRSCAAATTAVATTRRHCRHARGGRLGGSPLDGQHRLG